MTGAICFLAINIRDTHATWEKKYKKKKELCYNSDVLAVCEKLHL